MWLEPGMIGKRERDVGAICKVQKILGTLEYFKHLDMTDFILLFF